MCIINQEIEENPPAFHASFTGEIAFQRICIIIYAYNFLRAELKLKILKYSQFFCFPFSTYVF